jgi:GT2 family glycosyltransferase
MLAALALSERRVDELPLKPEPDSTHVRQGRALLHLVLPRGAARVALLAEGGLLIRQLSSDAGPPADLPAWLTAKPAEAERATALRYLSERGAAGDAVAGALASEIGLFAPQPPIAVTDPALPVGGEIDFAVDDGTGHAFLTGWLRDPMGLVERIDAGPGAVVRTMPRPDLAEQLKLKSAADIRALQGFVIRLPGSAQLTEVALQLRSGTRLRLRPAARALAAAAARDAVLAALPADLATDALLAETVLPAAQALNAAHLASRRSPELVEFGTGLAKPTASIVVPLYRNLDFLPFQVAAFAMDRTLGEVELIYVLDSPEQRSEVEARLRHLASIYGCAIRLLVMSGNFGYAAANNAGAAVARGDALALLNSDVVPEAADWLSALTAPLQSAGIGAVGARLLFDDGSLQHAGLYFAPDDRGAWRNRHFFKGLPRDFAPAAQARAVPAVTGACLVLRRAVYERLGGFDESYLVGDYEDSDLCLKLAADGLGCWYEPKATLLHLERQSVPLHRAHARGLASECNRVLHAGRWQAAMEEAMRRFQAGAGSPRAAVITIAPPARGNQSRRKGRHR